MQARLLTPRTRRLQLLIVEDSEVDTLLLMRQLNADQYEVEWERVETADAMRQALHMKHPDIIICDYNFPQFSAEEALQVLETSGLDVPFIVLSGTIGEDSAVTLMKAGARDIIHKHHLTRLMPTIERERAQATLRHENRRIRAQLEDNVTR